LCGGGIFTGSASSFPGYVKPRLQTVFSDGTIEYADEKTKPVVIAKKQRTENNLEQKKTQLIKIPTSSTVPELVAVSEKPSSSIFISNITYGDFGSSVTQLQQKLRELGFFTYPENTGYFSTITEEAVRAFQKANGIETVGIVGPKTRAALNTPLLAEVTTSLSISRFSRYLVTGTYGEEVIQLQKVLRSFDYFKYPQNTGYFGLITSNAVRDFQRDRGIEPVGVVGPKTRAALNSL